MVGNVTYYYRLDTTNFMVGNVTYYYRLDTTNFMVGNVTIFVYRWIEFIK
jgi:hypothetical protein